MIDLPARPSSVGAPPPELSIVLPARDEAANITLMIAPMTKILASIGTAEIIFIDDGSRDGTLMALRAAAAGDAAVRYISFPRNFGHQAALRAGLRHARGHAVVVMDADFEHPPELIVDFVAAWRAGAKVVATPRKDDVSQVSATKRLTSRFYYLLLEAIGDVRIAPGSADYMLLDRAVIDVVNSLEDLDIFLRWLVRWFGFPIVTVPFSRGQRREDDGKYTPRRMVALAVTGIAAHSVLPLRCAVGLIPRTVAGWSSIIAAIAILGAAQLTVIGIIGEYVGRILCETRRRPSHIVLDTEVAPPGRWAEVAGGPAAWPAG